MAASIIDLAKQYLTSEVVHKMSGALGEDPEHVEKAIGAGIPTILAGLLNMSSSSGANRLVDMLKQEPTELSHLGGLDGVFGNLGSILSGGGSADGLMKYGQTLLSAIFGGKISSIVDLITRSVGIKSSSATSLLGMLAPLLMGVIKKELATRGVSAGALTNLLMSQKDQIAKYAPAGLSNVLGLKSLTDLGSVADSVKSASAVASREFGRAATAAASEGSAWLRWAAPLALLAAALLGVLYYYNNGAAQPTPDAGAPTDRVAPARPVADRAGPVADRVAPPIKGASDAITRDGKSLVATASKMVPLSLPGNVTLEVPENSFLQGLVKSLSAGAGTGEPKSFVADTVNFEGTGAELTGDSSAAITKLATVLKAFGTAKLKIEAYTDNTSDPTENKKTSQERATTVKDALVKAGVPADRIVAVGAGSEHPIASNDTEEGRAKNRRIELSVVPL